MTLFRKARFFWVYPLAIFLFATASTSEPSLRLGVALVLLGEALRFWADGYVGHVKVNATKRWRHEPKIGRLITAGPYAYVRHPLYVGTFLIGAGFCIATRNLLFAIFGLIFFVFIYREKVRREERSIWRERGEEYAAYERAVPRWLPALRPYPQRQGKWSWQGIRSSKEWKTLLWVVVVLLAVYFWEEWVQERELFTEKKWLQHTLLMILLAVLVVSDGVIELVRRWRRQPKEHPGFPGLLC